MIDFEPFYSSDILIQEPMYSTLSLSQIQSVPARSSGYVVQSWSDGAEYLTGKIGKTLLYSAYVIDSETGYAATAGTSSRSLNWTVIVRESTSAAFSSVRQIVQSIVLAQLLIGFIVIAVLVIWITREINPILLMSSQVDKVRIKQGIHQPDECVAVY